MWHADEGVLSAYLDGELKGHAVERSAQEIEVHLAACAECRALLDEVKRTRDRASDILASSGPSALEIPPFEELRARKEARSHRHQARRLGRARVLAWAATIVMAAGIGWFARDAILTRDTRQLDAPGAPPATAVEPPTERLAEAFGPERDAAAPAEQRVNPGERADRPATAPQLAVDEALPQRTVVPARADPEALETPVARGALASTARKREADRAAPEAEQQIVSPAAAIANVTIRRQEDSAQRAREAAPRAALPDNVPAGRISPDSLAMADKRSAATSRWDALSWNTVSAAAAEARWGGPVPRIEGLPATSYSFARMPGGEAARVTQIIDGMPDVPLHVISYKRQTNVLALDQVAVTDTAPAPRAGNVAEVTEHRGNYVVVLRGQVPRDSLTSLLRKVVPRPD